MSAPADSVSSFIVQHNLMPWLLSYTAVTTIAALRKLGSALKKISLDVLRGLRELHSVLCDCLAGCYANWWRCKARCSGIRRRYEQVAGESVRVVSRAGGE